MDTSAQLDIPLPALPGIEKGWEILMVEENRASGLFTADKLAKDEAKRAIVVRALAEGMSIRSIAASQGCSVNTVLKAKKRWGSEIETLKQELGRDALDVARMAMERIRDEMQDMPKASLPIIMGVLTDKGLLLTGAPTMRIQHDHTIGVADMADYIASLPNVSASVQPVGSGESEAQKALGGAGSEIALAGIEELVMGGDQVANRGEKSDTRDLQSPVSAHFSEACSAGGTESGQITAKKEGQS